MDGTLYEQQQRKRWGKGRVYFYDKNLGQMVEVSRRPASRVEAPNVWAREQYNKVLGCYVSSTRDVEKKAKARGWAAIGDAKFSDVARQVWPDHELSKVRID